MSEPAARPANYLVGAKELLQGLRLGGVGVWRWRIDGDELFWTDNLEAVHGDGGVGFDGTLESFRREVHPDDSDRVWKAVAEAVNNRTGYNAVYRTRPQADGTMRWIETRGGVVTENGETWLTGICLDVTARIEAEQELQRRLKQQKAIEELGSFAIGESSLQAVTDRAVRIAADVLEVPFTKILQLDDQAQQLRLIAGVGWRDGLVGHATFSTDLASQAGFTLLENRPVVVEDLSTDSRFSGAELLRSHGVASGMSTIIAGDAGRPFGVFGAHTDERRRFDRSDTEFLTALANIVASSVRHIAAVEHRLLLVREMAHRAGNLLQLVDTLAHRTFSANRNLEEARRAFSSRLSSLSRANYLIAKGGWSLTRFSALAEETLEPFRDRVHLDGRDVLLPPELCFDLGLILHELSTNAVKYGCFAREDGMVDLRWSVMTDASGKEWFHLEWIDETVSNQKNALGTGFGSKLMRLIIERKWSGTIEPAAKAGYRFAFVIPLLAGAKVMQDS